MVQQTPHLRYLKTSNEVIPHCHIEGLAFTCQAPTRSIGNREDCAGNFGSQRANRFTRFI